MKKTTLFILVSMVIWTCAAQIPVKINSGNPRFPFPQFKDYGPGRKSLGTVLPDGVSHAEMEQWTRDAYQIMMNTAKYTGVELNGVKYINYATQMGNYSEGDGYALLAAAYMADKTTFDGLWLNTHDSKMVNSINYKTCQPTMSSLYSNRLPSYISGQAMGSAADADFDITLALITAWKQWGEDMGINDQCGNKISYKKEALAMINALSDTKKLAISDGHIFGDIGADGYVKGGNTWNELSSWATGKSPKPEFQGPFAHYIDYNAPSYFRVFRDILQANGGEQWNLTQLQRAEVSSDWLIGKMYEMGYLPFAGKVSMDTDGQPVFTNYNEGEDFRTPWRNILGYVWHGNPRNGWNPVTHSVTSDSNSFQYKMALRLSAFLKNPQKNGQSCLNTGGMKDLSFQGASTLTNYYSISGQPLGNFQLNWLFGTGAPAGVAAQDFQLMSEMFRQAVIKWHGTSGYLESQPDYFHGWFRLLGMLVLTGNYHTPLEMTPSSNVRVYVSADKTVASAGDTIAYTVSLKNYGSVDAANVLVKYTIPADVQIVNAGINGSLTGNTLTWNISSIKGFLSSDSLRNKAAITFKIKVKPGAHGKLKAPVVAVNGQETAVAPVYPDEISTVYRKNEVDIISSGLVIEKSYSVKTVNPGDTLTVTLKIRNNSSVLKGGRPGVNFAYTQNSLDSGATIMNLMTRVYHAAHEPYIDYGNYRFKYFSALNSSFEKMQMISEGFAGNVGMEVVPVNGYSEVRFRYPSQLAAPSIHLFQGNGSTAEIHRGTLMNLRSVTGIYATGFAKRNWAKDWSWNKDFYSSSDNAVGFPVAPVYTSDSAGVLPDKVHPDACQTVAKKISRVVLEEWDGTTWRRVSGTGPVEGALFNSISVTEQLSDKLVYSAMIKGAVPQVVSGKLTWTIPVLKPGETAELVFKVKAKDVSAFPDCRVSDTLILVNSTTLTASGISTINSLSAVIVDCPLITSLPETSSEQVMVFPNPFTNSTKVEMNGEGSVEIMTADGQLLEVRKIKGNETQLGESLVPGFYLLRININDKVSIVKLVKN